MYMYNLVMESACQRETFIILASVLCLFFVDRVVSQDLSATCTIQPLGDAGSISGVIKLTQSSTTGNTTVVGRLYGFVNGITDKRGFHVHQYGNLSDNCNGAGPHYNPLNKTHGAPSDTERHVGDLGNIIVDSNLTSFINITDNVISLQGTYSIVNRSLVVHSGEDDLGRGNSSTSKTTGNSGSRIGCCIITLDQQVTTASPAPTQANVVGSGQWMYPPLCSSNSSCLYTASWSLDKMQDVVTFTIVAQQPTTMWTAIGIAPQRLMQNVDVIYGYVNSQSQGVIYDGWIGSQHSRPFPDPMQNLLSSNITYMNGYLTLTFSRNRISSDMQNDYNFTNSDCYYFLFPVGGGTYNADGTINRHSSTPMISDNKICISNAEASSSSPSSSTSSTTGAPSISSNTSSTTGSPSISSSTSSTTGAPSISSSMSTISSVGSSMSTTNTGTTMPPATGILVICPILLWLTVKH